MGKPKITVYAYTEDGVATKFTSMADAVYALKVALPTIRKYAVSNTILKDYLLAFEPLQPKYVQEKFEEHEKHIAEEAERKLEKEKQKKQRSNDECKEIIGIQEFSVDCTNRQVTYIPRNRKEKVALLKKLIWATLSDRWYQIPQKIAVLEKRAFEELLYSLL